jgi:hypothetical protein
VVSCYGFGHDDIGQRRWSEGYQSREYVGSCAANSLGEYVGSRAADSLDEYIGPGATHTLELESGNSR